MHSPAAYTHAYAFPRPEYFNLFMCDERHARACTYPHLQKPSIAQPGGRMPLGSDMFVVSVWHRLGHQVPADVSRRAKAVHELLPMKIMQWWVRRGPMLP